MQQGSFRLNQHFTIAVTGHPAERMYGGATRLLRRLGRLTGLFFQQGFVTGKDTNPDAALVIRVHRPGQVKLGEDESYRLRVTPHQIELSAEDDIGALRGLQTVLQLVCSDQSGYYLPDVKINDHPRFPWRGLMIDVARHFEPVNVIERELDGMAAVKLNVLHLHLTDDQGFRIQSKVFPKLTGMGSRGNFYTQQQMKRIIKYANERGIRVVPEFDLPAHSTSWFVGYPQYASAPGPYQLKVGGCQGLCDPVFDPTKPNTYRFLARFFKEMTALFPDEYVHIGGDENNGVQWSHNPHIQAFMKQHGIKTTAGLQTYFTRRLSKIITRDGKKVIGWDEILQPGVPKTAVIQSWRGKQSLYKAAKEGHPAILSRGYYLKFHPAAYYYKTDPIPATVHLAPRVKNNILGGEAARWAWMMDPTTIDIHTWPATAAIAERLWSPRRLRNVAWMYRRLHAVSLLLENYGLTHIKNQNMLLRQLAGRHDIRPLKILVNVIGPLTGNQRLHNKTFTVYSPLTSIADAAHADAWTALQFNRQVDRFVQHPNPDLEQAIRADLKLWKNNAPALDRLIKHSPDLHAVKPLADSLAKLSRIGIQALDAYDKKRRPSKQWDRKTADVFSHAKQPAAGTKLRVVDAMKELVRLVE
jgi:hexosaminidase